MSDEIIIFFIGVCLVILVRYAIFEPTRYKKYRRYLVDMLVAGKVRQLAIEENVDLIKEDAIFLAFCKKHNLDRMYKVDEEIEEKLAKKIGTEKSEDIEYKQITKK